MKRFVCISCFDDYSTRMQFISEYFAEKDFQVKYLYANFDHYKKSVKTIERKFGIKIKVPKYKKNISVQRLYSHHIFAEKVGIYIKKYNPDIIYCMFPPNSLVKKMAKYKIKNSKVKLIFDCYDNWPESYLKRDYKGIFGIPFTIWKNLRKNYINTGDMVICVSEVGRKLLETEVEKKDIKIIKPIIQTGKIPKYNSNIQDLSFCYLGMINHIIDMDMGVLILGGIAKRRKTTLHIIGEGQNLNEFTTRLKSVNVNVISHGIIFDMDKKNEIFAQCSLGLNIPHEEINSTMPLKAVEYMRAGIPFLNNALGDIRHIVEVDEIGINIDKNNIDNLVKRVLSLDPSELILMHENCVRTYTDRFVNQDYDSIFAKIVKDDL